jgi:hypothetical protein
VLALVCLASLGCTRKVLIEVPASFHGHVVIHCGVLTEDRSNVLRVDVDGTSAEAPCPVRQTDTLVTRANSGTPVETSVMWLTTGDGLVREMSFDIP